MGLASKLGYLGFSAEKFSITHVACSVCINVHIEIW